MFKIFKGTWRGTPAPKPEETIFVQVSADFRNKLHHFKGAKLAVFMAIALHMDENGLAFPSYETLERETGYGQDTIANALKELCATCIDGDTPVLIRWRIRDAKGHYDGSNRYRLFPTTEEVAQTWKMPKLENTKGGENQVEEESNSLKDNQKDKKNKEGADALRGVNPLTGELPPSKNEKPAAVQVYREVMHLYPAKAWYDAIVAAVGEDGLSLQRWRDVLMQWIGRGYSPKNVEGVIEVFKKGWRKVAKAEGKPNGKPRDMSPEERERHYLGGKFGNEIQH